MYAVAAREDRIAGSRGRANLKENMGNMTVLQMSCCKNEDVHPDRERESEKEEQTCVVRWNAVPPLTAALRTVPAPPPAVQMPRSVSQATTLPGDIR